MSSERRRGFTIVELLIVIVVIGVLASVTVVAYGSSTKGARLPAIVRHQSDNKSYRDVLYR